MGRPDTETQRHHRVSSLGSSNRSNLLILTRWPSLKLGNIAVPPKGWSLFRETHKEQRTPSRMITIIGFASSIVRIVSVVLFARIDALLWLDVQVSK